MSFEGVKNLKIVQGLSSDRSYLSCTPNGVTVDLWNVDDESGRQQWEFIPVEGQEHTFNIKIYQSKGLSTDRCYLSCTENGEKVDLWHTDDGSGRQRWIAEPVPGKENIFTIRIAGGVCTDRKYLSCTPDGIIVDLWGVDDESGRQRWEVLNHENVKYHKSVFVNELLEDRSVKTASKFIAYRTWNDSSLWFAEVVDNGNAFFHWHQGDKSGGHKDTIINYITADGTKWQATIQNFVFFHSPEGDRSKGHSDTVIAYISGDNRAYVGSFAEWYDE